jgi:hypothetical protein
MSDILIGILLLSGMFVTLQKVTVGFVCICPNGIAWLMLGRGNSGLVKARQKQQALYLKKTYCHHLCHGYTNMPGVFRAANISYVV